MFSSLKHFVITYAKCNAGHTPLGLFNTAHAMQGLTIIKVKEKILVVEPPGNVC